MSRSPSKFRRWLRRIARCACVLLVTGAVGLGAFLIAAHNAVPEFRPVSRPLPADTLARVGQEPKYKRDEDATYLTFVEWYLVFNPQEYAQFIATRPPSQFPYFRGIAQIWRGYANVYGMTRRYYAFNPGYNLMLVVIGTSSTVEFGVKGIYEKTIGRFFEWTAAGARTAEDDYAAKVAREYGEFIPTQPWFEFPFGAKFVEVWKTTGMFGSHFLRKTERKLFLSFEYGLKTLYAGVIRLASHAVYGMADTEVYLTARDLTPELLDHPGVRKVEPLSSSRWIITVPHYQGFTDTIPLLAAKGANFEEIAGNDEIMLTVITPAEWKYPLPDGRPLFEMPLLADPTRKRVAVQMPIGSLAESLRLLSAEQLKIEHLYDY